MIKGYELLTAWRYVRGKKNDGFISIVSWFSLLGITLGVAALILVMSVMGGFREELLGRVLGINGHVTLTNGLQTIENYKPIEKRLVKYDGVQSAIGFIRKQALLSTENSARGVIVRGIDTHSLEKRDLFHKAVSKKHLSNFKAGKGLLIGEGLALMYGLRVGDEITLVVPQKKKNALGVQVPKVKSYKIAGTFSVGMHRYDGGMLFMSLTQAQNLFALKGVTQVEVTLDNADKAFDFEYKIENDFPTIRYIDAWQTVNTSFFNALEVERNTMFIILSVMVLIAAFNVITGQIMLVRDKMRSIAIMRTIGMTRLSVVKIFFMVGATLGVIGTGVGVGLGLFIADNLESIRVFTKENFGFDIFNPEIYQLKTIPTVIEQDQILFIAGFSIAISFLAALYPAIRAGRMKPVEGLRHD